MTSNVLVEKYRPNKFEEIVLDPLNKKILKNIIETGYFPNLLFYGPPGTGKTTTIINLVNSYQEKLNQKNKELMIHLNASDERGIDIIRSQINQFVNSKTMFNHGMKFVILDEVDYMTKNAQQALRYLLQNFSNNVRFCLICNYISRIDEGLQNEFLRANFLVPNIKEYGWSSSSTDPFDPTTAVPLTITLPVGTLTGTTTITQTGGLLFENTVNSANFSVVINGQDFYWIDDYPIVKIADYIENELKKKSPA